MTQPRFPGEQPTNPPIEPQPIHPEVKPQPVHPEISPIPSKPEIDVPPEKRDPSPIDGSRATSPDPAPT